MANAGIQLFLGDLDSDGINLAATAVRTGSCTPLPLEGT